MNKRFVSLLLCTLLALTACACGEEVVGIYRISAESMEASSGADQALLDYYPFAGALLTGILGNAAYEFDPEHNVLLHYEIPDLSMAIQAFSPYDYVLSWFVADGHLTYRVTSIDTGEETLVLESSVDGDTLRLSIDDDLTLMFTRLSDTTDYEGTWQLNMDAFYENIVERLHTNDGLEAAAQKYLQGMKSTFDNTQLRLYLNSDGTIGFGFDEFVGTYDNGVIIARQQDIPYMPEGSFSTSTIYTLEGDTLTMTTTNVIFGVSQVETLILIRES